MKSKLGGGILQSSEDSRIHPVKAQVFRYDREMCVRTSLGVVGKSMNVYISVLC